MVHMSELHKVSEFVRKEVVWITFWIFDFIEQNGPNRKKYSMNIARRVINDIISLNKMVQTGKNIQ